MELKLFGISTATNLKDICVAILQDKAEKRLLPLVITPEESKELMQATGKKQKHNTTLALASTWRINIDHVSIELDADGNLACWLVTNQNGEERQTSVTLAEALGLAVRMNCPIIMSEEDFFAQYIDENGMARIPLSRMSGELLQAALESAVKEENFEMAAKLRDEINLRK